MKAIKALLKVKPKRYFWQLHDAIWIDEAISTDEDSRRRAREKKRLRVSVDFNRADFAEGLRNDYVAGALRVREDCDAVEPFLVRMINLEVVVPRLRTDPYIDGTVEIVFAAPERPEIVALVSPDSASRMFDVGEAIRAECGTGVLFNVPDMVVPKRRRRTANRADDGDGFRFSG